MTQIDHKAPTILSLELIHFEHSRPFYREAKEDGHEFKLLAGNPSFTVLYLRLPDGRIIAVEPKGDGVMVAIVDCIKQLTPEKFARATTNQERNDGSEQNGG